MNKNEKNAVILMLCLFAFGLAARYAPWSLPEIGESAVEIPVVFETDKELVEIAKNSLDSTINLKDSLLYINEGFAEDSFDSAFKAKKQAKSNKKSKPKFKLPIAINSASTEALCAIPGVGPKLAEKIIEHRKTRGPIKNEAELKKVPGIGEKKSKKLLPSIIFD